MNRVHPLRLGVLALGLAVAASGPALAQRGPGFGGPGFGWHFAPHMHGYYSGEALAREDVESAVAALLAKAQKGEAWTGRRGMRHIPLTVDGEIVGHLWDDRDVSTLTVGPYWAGRFGTQVELVAEERVVGILWLQNPVTP
jgi:hypothetical protein